MLRATAYIGFLKRKCSTSLLVAWLKYENVNVNLGVHISDLLTENIYLV